MILVGCWKIASPSVCFLASPQLLTMVAVGTVCLTNRYQVQASPILSVFHMEPCISCLTTLLQMQLNSLNHQIIHIPLFEATCNYTALHTFTNCKEINKHTMATANDHLQNEVMRWFKHILLESPATQKKPQEE